MEAGLDVVRLNFSHGTAQDHIDRAELVRSLARARGRAVGVLVDLQGPKIRIGKFKDGKITLAKGDTFILDAGLRAGRSNPCRPRLQGTARMTSTRGVTLLLDDGRIEFWVEEVKGTEIICNVVQGGVLSNNKGINRKGGGLSAAALTDQGHRRHQDRRRAEGGLPGGVVSALRRRHAPGARTVARGRRQEPAGCQDRAHRSDRKPGRNPRCLRRHHGGARRPRRGSRRRGRARACRSA